MTPYLRHEGIQHRNNRTPWRQGHCVLTRQDAENDDMINHVNDTIAAAMMLIVENQLLMMMGK